MYGGIIPGTTHVTVFKQGKRGSAWLLLTSPPFDPKEYTGTNQRCTPARLSAREETREVCIRGM